MSRALGVGDKQPTSATPTATVANDASGLTETQAPTSPDASFATVAVGVEDVGCLSPTPRARDTLAQTSVICAVIFSILTFAAKSFGTKMVNADAAMPRTLVTQTTLPLNRQPIAPVRALKSLAGSFSVKNFSRFATTSSRAEGSDESAVFIVVVAT